MNEKLAYLVELVVAIYFIAYLLPNAISTLINATIPNAPAGVSSLLSTFIPVMVILSIVLLLMPTEIKQRVGLHIELVEAVPSYPCTISMGSVSIYATMNYEPIG
jgi:hypothetical protein